MSKNTLSVCLPALFALAILLLPAADAAAQSQIPIVEEEIVASVTVGSMVIVAPAALALELEMVTGQPAAIQTMGDLLDVLPEATPSNSIRFEGGFAAGSVVLGLEQLGYSTQADGGRPLLPSAGSAEVWTD